jgi:putative copper export protein/mono/diheme cytochrome c family protein
VTPAEVALAVSRGIHMAATLSFGGALVFHLAVTPYPLARVLRPSLAVALLAGVAWLVLQAADLAEASNLAKTAAAVPVAVLHTRFGHMLLLRLALLPVAAGVAGSGNGRGRLAIAALLGIVAVAIEAALGHVAASGSPLLIASLVMHLTAASVWLGGLWPLWLALRDDRAGAVARRFSMMAIMAVAFIAASAFQQGAALFGGLPGLVGTDYGHTALAKLSILVLLLIIAAVNRFVLTPAVDAKPLALRELRISVVIETVLGLGVVMAAARLASLPPGVHLQPDWPFAWRLSLDAMADQTIGAEIKEAMGAMVSALVPLVVGIEMRRVRWLTIAASVVIAVLAAPHLSPLLVPAYPTSFYVSLTDFDGDGIAHGAELFARYCMPCHGADGRGNGPLAHAMLDPPADLTAEHLWAHSDGEMFWYLTHGIETPRGDPGMPGFGDAIRTEGRWELIDYLRAHNAGVAVAATGVWNHPIPAPELEARCADGRVVAMEDLRGQVVRIIVGAPALTTRLTTLFIDPSNPHPGTCVAQAPEVRLAYAIVAGLTPKTLAGTVFLADPAGWLRNRIMPIDPAPDYESLARQIIAHPLAPPPAIGHHH